MLLFVGRNLSLLQPLCSMAMNKSTVSEARKRIWSIEDKATRVPKDGKCDRNYGRHHGSAKAMLHPVPFGLTITRVSATNHGQAPGIILH